MGKLRDKILALISLFTGVTVDGDNILACNDLFTDVSTLNAFMKNETGSEYRYVFIGDVKFMMPASDNNYSFTGGLPSSLNVPADYADYESAFGCSSAELTLIEYKVFENVMCNIFTFTGDDSPSITLDGYLIPVKGNIDPTIYLIGTSPVSVGNVGVGNTKLSSTHIEAINLTENLVVTSQSSTLKVSLDGVTYTDSVEIESIDGDVGNTTIYVQIIPTDEGDFDLQIVCSSVDCLDLNIFFDGSCVAPMVVTSPTPLLSLGNRTHGVPSAGVDVAVNGNYIQGGDSNSVTFTSTDSNLEISKDGGSTWVSSFTMDTVNGLLDVTSFKVRYTPVVGANDGFVNITSLNMTTVGLEVTCTGT